MMTSHPIPEFEPTPDEKAAVRGYLQRAEVRLSTMHRIAGAFLNGAGILFLLPVFMKDVVLQILGVLVPGVFLGHLEYIPHILMMAGVLALPMWAFYLLIEDIVKFYFTAYHAGIRENFFHPRFILSGITFSEDESERINQQIIEIEHSPSVRRFIVPENAEDREYYRKVYDTTRGEIVPETRKKYLDQNADPVERADIRHFYTAFGLTGVIDRTLAGEAAKMEMSLVRHALNLRHLVLRYAKALLMFVFTTFLLLIFNQITIIINNSSTATNNNTAVALQILSLAFAIWGILTPIVVTQPLRWVYQAAERRLGITNIRSDARLKTFERIVIAISILIFGSGLFFTNAFGIKPLHGIWIWVSVLSSIALFMYWYPKTFAEQALVTFPDKNMDKAEDSQSGTSNKAKETKMPIDEKKPIFISYSHKDREWLEGFKTHLKVLQRNKKIQVWDDTQIKSGARWNDEIKKGLAAARVALLLVTPDFLASDFITNNELPHLLKAAEKDGLIILWVAVKPSLVHKTEIADFQAANDPSKPLNSLREFERENEIIKICQKIQDAAE